MNNFATYSNKIIERYHFMNLNLGENDKCLEFKKSENQSDSSCFIFGVLCVTLEQKIKISDRLTIFQKCLNGFDLAPFPECKTNKSGDYLFSIEPLSDFGQFDDILRRLYEYSLDHATGDVFGCCHRYLQCSDEKQCVHPNLDRAKNCMYFHNLRKGKIFYGKNRNIDK